MGPGVVKVAEMATKEVDGKGEVEMEEVGMEEGGEMVEVLEEVDG